MNDVEKILKEPAIWRWDKKKQSETAGLVKLAKQGDEDASVELLRRYSYFMAKTVNGFLINFKNDETMNDVFSEAKLALWESVAKFDAKRKAPFTVLLRFMVLRRVVGFIRSSAKHGGDGQWPTLAEVRHIQTEHTYAEAPICSEDDPREALLRQELYQGLEHGLKLLTADERRVLKMIHEDGLPLTKIRAATKFHIHVIKLLLASAESKLRGFLENQ